jgi:triosephosphate isomerase
MVLPGTLHLPLVQALLKDHILIGAQNCSSTGEGAYTGEVSCDHLKDYRIDNVLIGHNERRKLFNETQAVINDKIHQA